MIATTAAIVGNFSPVVRVTDDNKGLMPVRANRDGDTVVIGGIGQAIIAIPGYLFGSLAAHFNAPSYRAFTQRLFVLFTNSAVTALGAAIFFLISRSLGASRQPALLLALVYGLGTMAWPHAKTFFSEPLATTLLLACAYQLIRATEGTATRSVSMAGLAFGFSLVARSSNAVLLLVIGFYLAWDALAHSQGWMQGISRALGRGGSFVGGMMPGVLVVGLTNWWRFGSATDFGYPSGSVPFNLPLWDGLYGFFLSPGKSIFLYAPPVAVGLVSTFFLPPARRVLSLLLVSLGAANVLFFARFHHWHGDSAWGPRYLMMSLPFFILPVASLLDRDWWRRALLFTGFLGGISACLGSMIYFNQYLVVARESQEAVSGSSEDPAWWDTVHYEPYWSPVLGHARAVPDAIRNSIQRLDGEDERLSAYPRGAASRLLWYTDSPQVDTWMYWVFPAHAPKKLLALAPFLFVGLALASVTLFRDIRGPGDRVLVHGKNC